MSRKPSIKGASRASQPALAQMLFAAINEHNVALARVARLLHDDVSQVLSAVGLQLDAMRMDLRVQAPAIDDRATEIQTMLEQVIEQLRDISNDLNPSVVERAGLQFALDRLAGKIRKRFSGTLRLHLDPATHVPVPIAKAFYQIAECALDGALARPGCTLIEIQLKQTRAEFVLEVHDNGKTAEKDSSAPSLERLMMDYYASRSQVALEVQNSSNRGIIVRASHPVPAAVPGSAN